jgi:hypothetical protein
MSQIRNEIEKLKVRGQEVVARLGLDKASPNQELINQVLSYDAALLYNLTDYNISTYIVALGQYLVMLQVYKNQLEMLSNAASRKLEFELSKKKLMSDSKVKINEKDRRCLELIADPDLMDASNLIDDFSIEQTLLTNISGALEELLNALKKEKSSRDLEKQYGSH